MSAECLVVTYHYVRDVETTPYPATRALGLRDFGRQLDWLARDRHPITFELFEAAMRGGTELPDRAALLTFDDGFVDHAETVTPALAARGWSGVFFVAGATLDDPPCLLNVHKTQFLLAALGASRFAAEVEGALAGSVAAGGGFRHRREVYRYDESPDVAAKHRLNYEMPPEAATLVLSGLFAAHIGDEQAFARELYVTPEQVRAMAQAGMTFGFHTERHPVLSRLPADAQRDEVAGGVARIRALTGQRSVPFCYPYGHAHTYNADTVAVLDAAGYSLAFTTARRLVRPGEDHPFELPRIDTRDLPPFSEGVRYA